MFPPILKSSQAAMVTASEYRIYFSFPNTMSTTDVHGVYLSVTNQVNNKNLIKEKQNYVPKDIHINEEGQYYITLNPSNDIINGILPSEQYYKIQLAFFKAEQRSEWSTVMIIKIIDPPTVTILNDNTAFTGLKIESSLAYEQSDTPLFVGQFQAAENSNEYVDQYRFVLKRENELYYDTGWLQHDSALDQNSNGISIDQWYPKESLSAEGTIIDSEGNVQPINPYTYNLQYFIRTQNLYTTASEIYTFQIANTSIGQLKDINFRFIDNHEQSLEEGIVELYIKNNNNETYGNYVLTRKKENDSTLEELYYFQIIEGENDLTSDYQLIYKDYTIESGVKYRYFIQKINMYGLRSSALVATSLLDNITRYDARVDMQYSYLYADGVQLKLKYDNKMNSFKHMVQAAKQDTIGAKYATIVRNGHSYYAEFPINALISINLDENLSFFNLRNENQLYYRDELILELDIMPQKRTFYQQNLGNIRYHRTPQIINLTAENAYIERKFREKVEEFLNTTPYFLFKSPTEGNIIISLINVAFQPNDQLSRQIAAMTATAYETMECTINNMASIGLITVGSYNPVLDTGIKKIGQISGTIIGEQDWFQWIDNTIPEIQSQPILTSNSENIYELIKEDIYTRQVSESNGDTVIEIELYNLKTITFEPYPNIDFTDILRELSLQINEIEVQLKDIENKTQYELSLLEQQKKNLTQEVIKYQQLTERIKYDKRYPLITLFIGGNEISVGYNKILHLENLDFTDIRLKYTMPIIINYTATAESIESEKETPMATVTSSTWDQLAGVFTNKPLITAIFEANTKDNDSYYYNDQGEVIGISQERGELYPTLKIRHLIEAKARRDTFAQYGDNVELQLEIPTEGRPYYYDKNNGKIKYYFDSIKKISIEAQPGTEFKLYFGEGNQQIVKTITMGPTWRFTLNPVDISELPLYDIEFVNGTYAIIDYICLIQQELYKESIKDILKTIEKTEE